MREVPSGWLRPPEARGSIPGNPPFLFFFSPPPSFFLPPPPPLFFSLFLIFSLFIYFPSSFPPCFRQVYFVGKPHSTCQSTSTRRTLRRRHVVLILLVRTERCLKLRRRCKRERKSFLSSIWCNGERSKAGSGGERHDGLRPAGALVIWR